MRSFTFIISPLFFTAFFLHFGCKKDPVSPRNLRELNWTVETLAHPDNIQTLIGDIWASSAKDIYVAGGANTTHGILWHFDGARWTDVKITITQGGPIVGFINFDDIYGFGPNDVWLVGKRVAYSTGDPDSSLLVHFDGIRWREIPTPIGRGLTAIWGPVSSNIWIAGLNGTLFHYDGTRVKIDTIPLAIPKDADPFYNVLSIAGHASETYMLLADFNSNPNRYFFLERNGNKWTVKDSTFFFNSHSLWLSPEGTLYVAGNSTYRRQGNTWSTFLEGRTTLWSFGIHGTSDNNLFVVGRSNTGNYPGAVYHYNGKDWFQYKNLENPQYSYYEVWTDGDEVFIVGTAGSKSIVLHGK